MPYMPIAGTIPVKSNGLFMLILTSKFPMTYMDPLTGVTDRDDCTWNVVTFTTSRVPKPIDEGKFRATIAHLHTQDWNFIKHVPSCIVTIKPQKVGLHSSIFFHTQPCSVGRLRYINFRKLTRNKLNANRVQSIATELGMHICLVGNSLVVMPACRGLVFDMSSRLTEQLFRAFRRRI